MIETDNKAMQCTESTCKCKDNKLAESINHLARTVEELAIKTKRQTQMLDSYQRRNESLELAISALARQKEDK